MAEPLSSGVSTQCPNCGGTLVFDSKSLVARCPFCATEIPLNKLIQRQNAVSEGPPSRRRRPFPWRIILYAWIVSIIVFVILAIIFSTDDRTSVNWIRSERAYRLFEYDVLIGSVVLLLFFVIRGLVRIIQNRVFKVRFRHVVPQEDEEARVKALLEKAVELKTTVLMIHNGGVDRRGTLSDAFIKLAFPYSTYAIVKLEGDTDNLMHDILAAKNVPSAFVEKDADVQAVMKYMFGK